ncbi:MAG: FAD-dependent oxidoreductase [Acidobacteria bacterium]|nr:MAG: FAD-dependent oxidoreductase [Acidobacteriota bacterium]
MATTAKDPTHVTVKLAGRDEIAERTSSFRFEKPPGWTFKSGQTVDITLLDPPDTDAEGNTRTFSIASVPDDNTLMIATRMRDTAFKRTLGTMPLGTVVKIDGPFGNFVLHNNPAKTAVLLAGGIGITPFRSMVFRAANEKLPHRIFLFLANRRPEDAAFLNELELLEKENPNYKLIATMTGMEKSSRAWHGEKGYIDKEMLSRYVKDSPSPIYYIAGPPGMVAGLREMLKQAGVDEDDIRAEDFPGY